MNDDAKSLQERYEPKELKALEAPRQLCAARFSPCGKFLLAGGYDGLVRRWDADKEDLPELPAIEGHRGWVDGLAFHPQQRRVFTADSWGQLCCWDYAEPGLQPAWKIDAAHDGWIRGVAVSPDGNQLATCGRDRTVRIWSTHDGRKLAELAGHDQDVYCVRFHPDGRSLVSGDWRGAVKQWDLATGRCAREFDARVLFACLQIQEVGGVRSLAFGKEGRMLACGGTQPTMGANVQGVPTVLVFDWSSGRETHRLQPGKSADGFVFDLAFHADGFLMAVTSGGPGNGKLLFQRLEDEEPFFTTTKMANCHALGVHPSGKRLAVTATNRDSAGNGLPLKNGKYPSNWSPIHVLDLPA
jgi:WD40 repeat protein